MKFTKLEITIFITIIISLILQSVSLVISVKENNSYEMVEYEVVDKYQVLDKKKVIYYLELENEQGTINYEVDIYVYKATKLNDKIKIKIKGGKLK